MTALNHPSNREGHLLIGGGLMVVGLIAAGLMAIDIDPSGWLAGSGWTSFVIIPGVLLLGAGLLTRRPGSEGLTIGGAIVTTVGLMLLAMDQTGTWQSWAYAWALIPAAAGGGLLLHGLRSHDGTAIAYGIRVGLVSLVMLLVGAWYFETIFQTGAPPFELGDAWPILLIGIGAAVLLSGMVRRSRDTEHPS